MKIGALLGLSIAGICTACGGMRTFEVETYNPADVTYPKSVEKVLMVNNAVPQPEDTGYTFVLWGEEQDTCRARADSALVELCRSLGTTIADASFFQDVLLYHDAVRTDGDYMQDYRLNAEQVRTLCEENGADAVISLDRVLFQMDKKVESYPQMGMEYGTIQVKASGILRTYVPEKEKALATVLLADSVMWEEAGVDLRSLNELLPSPNEALQIAAAYLGAKLSQHFIPHWSEASRWYYHNAGARWKEASVFASAGKWDDAENRWKLVERQTRSKKGKAEVYSNLALACEMQNKFQEAYEWAKKSAGLFLELEGEKGENSRLLKAYVQVLEERIRADRKLNIQIGE